MLNSTLLLRKPPPTTKGQSSMTTILETIPNVGETVRFAAMAYVLSDKYSDVVSFKMMSALKITNKILR